jgi:membrane-associated protein
MLEMILLDFNWTQLLQPQFYIDNGGLWLVLFIIFAETGLFAGFFLPGDSLLFVSGIFSSQLAASFYDTGNDLMNLLLVISLTAIAGILGNTVGFWFGKKIGPAMFTWKDRFLFKQRYLHQAKEFYDKHGGGAIVFARFLPLIRTFAPIVAGIVNMDRKKFGFYNVVGSVAWTASMLAAGHYLQKFFMENYNYDLKEHLEMIVLGIVLVTTAPILYKLLFGKKKDPANPLNSSE